MNYIPSLCGPRITPATTKTPCIKQFNSGHPFRRASHGQNAGQVTDKSRTSRGQVADENAFGMRCLGFYVLPFFVVLFLFVVVVLCFVVVLAAALP